MRDRIFISKDIYIYLRDRIFISKDYHYSSMNMDHTDHQWEGLGASRVPQPPDPLPAAGGHRSGGAAGPDGAARRVCG